ncbi:DNA excision repair protein [Acrasis kona]|uniref:DNA excision repair protein n=1 Tax=Acrasis kona TaxID=1008807 RepID=A0AAW2YLD7_9EUKA
MKGWVKKPSAITDDMGAIKSSSNTKLNKISSQKQPEEEVKKLPTTTKITQKQADTPPKKPTNKVDPPAEDKKTKSTIITDIWYKKPSLSQTTASQKTASDEEEEDITKNFEQYNSSEDESELLKNTKLVKKVPQPESDDEDIIVNTPPNKKKKTPTDDSSEDDRNVKSKRKKKPKTPSSSENFPPDEDIFTRRVRKAKPSKKEPAKKKLKHFQVGGDIHTDDEDAGILTSSEEEKESSGDESEQDQSSDEEDVSDLIEESPLTPIERIRKKVKSTVYDVPDDEIEDVSSDDDASTPAKTMDKIMREASEKERLEKSKSAPIVRKKPIKPIKDGKTIVQENGWTLDETKDEYSITNHSKKFILYSQLYDCLYDYQREGVKWLAERYTSTHLRGGILADDMGLGKTVQVSSFINGLFESKLAKRVMIVCPVSVLHTWEKELKKWTPNCKDVIMFHKADSDLDRNRIVMGFNNAIEKSGRAVMITSYGMVTTHIDKMLAYFDQHQFDLVVLDEGHRVKNHKTKISINLRKLKCDSKFILTGTPIMNRIGEMWALYDYIFLGDLLGSQKTFKMEYERDIVRSTHRDATNYEKVQGNNLSISLNKKIKPYFMRRTKADVVKIDNALQYIKEKASSKAVISQKNDFIVWCSLTSQQERVYRTFLTSEEVKGALNKTNSALVSFTVLKLICDHHILCKGFNTVTGKGGKKKALLNLSRDSQHDESDDESDDEDDKSDDDELPTFDNLPKSNLDDNEQDIVDQFEKEEVNERIKLTPVQKLINESTKIKLLTQLLTNNVTNGHRTLIFSQYARMLDIVERVVKEVLKYKYFRIDGTLSNAKERQHRVDTFNKDERYKCFLLTTQVGGIGLTLTGASRVILLDANWNPALDNQAVDRCYRIGQRKNVVVYRLVSCGTIEEKIYRKQIFKDTLSKNVQEKSNQYRYFDTAELREMLSLPEDVKRSKTCDQLQKLHTENRKLYTDLINHIEEIEKMDHVVGLTDHDLLFQKEADDDLNDAEDKMVHDMARYDAIKKKKEEQMQLRMTALNNLRNERMQAMNNTLNGGGLYPQNYYGMMRSVIGQLPPQPHFDGVGAFDDKPINVAESPDRITLLPPTDFKGLIDVIDVDD